MSGGTSIDNLKARLWRNGSDAESLLTDPRASKTPEQSRGLGGFRVPGRDA